MKKELREKAVRLRTEKEMSYSAIRKQLGVSKSTLSYWLRDYPLSEEKILELRRKGWKKGEASRERYRNTMRKKFRAEQKTIYQDKKKELKKISKDTLYVAGLMLYLGEGKKKDYYTISLSNTDPSIIQFFIKWLEDFMDIPKSSLRIQLHLYENMDVEKEKKFWENTLGLKKSQFYKSQIRKLQKGSFSYRESFRHGTCQVSFSNKRKKVELMESIRAFVDLYVSS